MPSPLAHAMAGAIVAWAAERLPPRIRPIPRATAATLGAGALLAVAPDIDLLYVSLHRTVTHSITAVAFTTIVVAAVTRWVTGRTNWGLAAVCGAAYGSHLVLDWLGEDLNLPRGIQVLWPLSDQWFLSGWDVFRSTQRARPLSLPSMLYNLRTAIQELLTLGPLLILLWMTKRRSTSS